MGARAILVAWVLAVQAVAPSLALASTVRASCCCARNHERCRCPVCARARTLEEGQDAVRSCGGDAGQALAPESIAAVPALSAALLPLDAPLTPRGTPTLQPPDLTQEVPTPPPLA